MRYQTVQIIVPPSGYAFKMPLFVNVYFEQDVHWAESYDLIILASGDTVFEALNDFRSRLKTLADHSFSKNKNSLFGAALHQHKAIRAILE